MENKYYTPKIEEFRVGFEYEIFEDFDTLPEKIWHKQVYGEDGRNPERMGYVGDNMNKFRVKFLDIDDLKEIGFRHLGRKTMLDIIQLFTLNNGRYFVHLEATWFSSWVAIGIYVSVYEDSERTLVVHSITINNKSELKVLMQQLNIS